MKSSAQPNTLPNTSLFWKVLLRGAQYEKAGVVPPAEDDDAAEWKVFLSLVRDGFEKDQTKWTAIAESVKGVTEETTTGVLRL